MEEKNINNAIKIFSRNFRLELKNIQGAYGKGETSLIIAKDKRKI